MTIRGLEQIQLGGMSKLDFSIAVMREHEARALEQSPEGYYLAFSGGKDSQVLRRVADLAGVKYRAYFHASAIEPPETIRFVRDQYPDTVFEKPVVPFWKAFDKKGFPLRKKRWSCEYIKEWGGAGRTVLTGVRSAESNSRRHTQMVNLDEKGRTRFDKELLHSTINPILLWTDRDVWGFLEQQGMEYCSLYDEGSTGRYQADGIFKRIGCVMCPLAATEQRLREYKRFPKTGLAWKAGFDRLYASKTALADTLPEGLTFVNDLLKCPACNEQYWDLQTLTEHITTVGGKVHKPFKKWAMSYLWKTRWPSGDAMFWWWLNAYEKPKNIVEGEEQAVLELLFREE